MEIRWLVFSFSFQSWGDLRHNSGTNHGYKPTLKYLPEGYCTLYKFVDPFMKLYYLFKLNLKSIEEMKHVQKDKFIFEGNSHSSFNINNCILLFLKLWERHNIYFTKPEIIISEKDKQNSVVSEEKYYYMTWKWEKLTIFFCMLYTTNQKKRVRFL